MPRDYSPTWADTTFARQFHRHGDRVAAAKAAGSQALDLYQAGTSLLAKPKIKRLLAEYDSKSDDACIRDRSKLEDEVHGLIDEGVKLARKGKPILGRDGKIARGVANSQYPKGEPLYQPDVPALLRGAELKGKTIAMFIDKQQVTGELEGLSDKELIAIMVGNLAANDMLLDAVSKLDVVIGKVHERDRQLAAGDEDGNGVQPEKAESLPSSSKAGEVPQRRIH